VLSLETLRVASLGDRGTPAANFLRMDRTAALGAARKWGANVLITGESGRVVAQTPAPGAPMDRDGVVRLFVVDAAGLAPAGVDANRRLRATYRETTRPDAEPRESHSHDHDARASKGNGVAGIVAAQSTTAAKNSGRERR
jgi:hypothetical protein